MEEQRNNIRELGIQVMEEYSMIPYPDREELAVEVAKVDELTEAMNATDSETHITNDKVVERLARSLEVKTRLMKSAWIQGETVDIDH